ncbi:MAG: hypothetical protein ACOYEQ_03745 [Bacillota bacterium]|jgi:hypothetical protein
MIADETPEKSQLRSLNRQWSSSAAIILQKIGIGMEIQEYRSKFGSEVEQLIVSEEPHQLTNGLEIS